MKSWLSYLTRNHRVTGKRLNAKSLLSRLLLKGALWNYMNFSKKWWIPTRFSSS
jgi:hypothetical protein